MNFFGDFDMYRGFEIDLAVTMRRVLVAETNPSHVRENAALKPSRQVLEELAQTHPVSLQCLAGRSYRQFPAIEGECSNVYMVGRGKKLVYLGIAMSKQQAEANWHDLLTMYRENEHMLRILHERGVMVPIRYFSSVYLPVPAPALTTGYLEHAVRLYCNCFIPKLQMLPIAWIPKSLAVQVDEEIWGQAQRSACRQTDEECARIHANERDFSPSNSHE